MKTNNEVPFSAFSYVSDKEETIYDGQNTTYHIGKGIHIRWQFNKYFGFPKNGFQIFDEKGNFVKKISLPENEKEFLSRINEGIDNPEHLKLINHRFQQVQNQNTRTTYVSQIISLINLLKNEIELPQYLAKLPVVEKQNSVSILDSLLMGSIDPYMAKGLGLYTVLPLSGNILFDSNISSQHLNYKIEGDWGDTKYPYKLDSFSNLFLRKESQKYIKLPNGTFNSYHRLLTVVNIGNFQKKCISIDGGISSLWAIQLSEALEQVELFLYTENRGIAEELERFDWELSSQMISTSLLDIVLFPESQLNYTIGLVEEDSSGSFIYKLTIFSKVPRIQFNEIYFHKSPSNIKLIRQVNYFAHKNKRIGENGILTALTSKQERKWESFKSYVLSEHEVPEILISNLQSKQAQPFFNAEGHIIKKASDVFLKTSYVFHPEKNTLPIRFLLNRMVKPDGISKPKPELLTQDDNNFKQPYILNQVIPFSHSPKLLAYFPLDGIITNTKNGKIPKLYGAVTYKNLNTGVGAKFIDNGYLEIDSNSLGKIGDRFTISFKTKLQYDISNSVVLSSDNPDVLFLGFNKENQIVFKLNRKEYITSWSLTEDNVINLDVGEEVWFIVIYNEDTITIHCKPILDENSKVIYGKPSIIFPNKGLFEKQDAQLGALETLGNYLDIAKSIDGYKGYKGIIKELSIWRDSVSFYQIHQYKAQLHNLELHQEKASLRFANTDRIKLENSGFVIPKSNLIGYIGKTITFQVWFKINVERGYNSNKIIEIDTKNELISKINVLLKFSDHRAIIIHKNDKEIEAKYDWDFRLNQFDWNKLTVSIHNEQSKLFINEQIVLRFALSEEFRISRIKLGDHIGQEYTHFTLWDEALTPNQIDDKLGNLQYIDRQLTDGTYTYNVTGVDLLGRVSERSTAKSITCEATHHTIDMPSSTFARISPLIGEILEVKEIEREEDVHFEGSDDYTITKKVYTIRIKLHSDILANQLKNSHYVTILRKIGENNIKQQFLIEKILSNNSDIVLEFVKPPFCQLFPKVGDAMNIDMDREVLIDWKWTGLQQIYNPEVLKFKLYTYTGHRNLIHTKIKSVVQNTTTQLPKIYTITLDKNSLITEQNLELFTDRFCRIGTNNYQIEQIKLNNGIPKITVKANAWGMPDVDKGQLLSLSLTSDFPEYKSFANTSDWDRGFIEIPHTKKQIISSLTAEVQIKIDRTALKERGISWMPDKKVVKVVFNSIPPSQLKNQEIPSIAHYVPSAIVAKVINKPNTPWESFTVLWHEWINKELICYMLLKEETEALMQLSNLSCYIGQHYKHTYTFNNGVEFYGYATLSCAFGVTACSDTIESKVSSLAHVTLVDKTVPPTPPRPIASSTGIADYYKKIKVDITWQASVNQDVLYTVFNTSYATVVSTDVESRRLFRGMYKNLEQNKAQVFKDDLHFEHWFDVVKNRDWQDPLDASKTFKVKTLEDLFPKKQDAKESHKVPVQWRKMSVVWQNWSERFYTALDDRSKIQIAEVEGNEEAFTLLNSKPIADTTFTSEVQGYDPDCFFYRVRTQSKALVSNPEWSLVSNPVYPKLARKPRKPELSKVIPGDRSVTLYWNLNREPRLSHYVIYRADTKEALEDLRWWRTSEDPRIVGKVDDPRIQTLNGEINITTNEPIKKVIGIYRASVFDYAEGKLPNYNTAFNYYDVSSVLENKMVDDVHHAIITKLKPIAEYTVVVIVYQTQNDKTEVQDTVKAYPKLKIENSTLQLPPFLEIKEIFGVYKDDEFDETVSPVTNQQARNYYYLDDAQKETALWVEDNEGDRIYNLFNLDENQELVLVYYYKKNAPRILKYLKKPLNFNNKHLEGLKKYHYAIKAVVMVDSSAYESESSNILAANSLAGRVLGKPTLEINRIKKEDYDTIKLKPILPAKHLQYKVQKRVLGDVIWNDLFGWKSLKNGYIIYDNIPSNNDIEYIIWLNEPSSNIRIQSLIYLSLKEDFTYV